MERAKTRIAVRPGLAQPYVLLNYLDDIDRGFELLDEIHATV